MDERLYELPESARRLVRTIESLVSEAQPLLQAPDVPPELVFTLRETVTRYLPDTISAFLAVPSSQRELPSVDGRTPVDLFLEQLSVLDRSARKTLETLSEHARSGMAANARFLAERFDDRSTDISSPTALPATQSPAHVLPAWFRAVGRHPREMVSSAAEKLQLNFPSMVQVRRAGPFAMGHVEAVDLTLPQGGGTSFRYTLSAREGSIEATVAKLVHGTVIQRVVCSPQEWLQSLYDDVASHVQHHQEARAAFASLFSR
jgi:hypothetical protein